MHRAYGSRGQGPITHRVMFLSRFSYFCIYMYLSLMKNFLGEYESQKAETWYKHGTMGGCIVLTEKKGPELIALGVISLNIIFFKFIMLFAYYNLYL